MMAAAADGDESTGHIETGLSWPYRATRVWVRVWVAELRFNKPCTVPVTPTLCTANRRAFRM